MIVGVVPALQATGARVQSGLRELGGSTGMRLGKTWTTLIVAQVALSVAILPEALVTVWDSVKYAIFRPGFDSDDFLAARFGMDRETPPSARAAEYQREFDARFAARHREIMKRIEAEPGVAGVT